MRELDRRFGIPVYCCQ